MDIPQKKLDRKYIAVLAVVAGLILLLGTWARPKPVKTEGPPAPSPVELMRLQRMTQIRNVQEISTLFSETAASTSRHLAWIPEHHLTGLILDNDGTLVTAHKKGEVFSKTTLVQTVEQLNTEAYLSSISPFSPVASLRIGSNSTLRPVQKTSTNTLAKGDWLVAVARRNNGDYTFSPGIYGGSSTVACGETNLKEITYSVPFQDSMLGGGVFDLNGMFVGLIVQCNDRIASITSSSVEAAIKEANSFSSQLVTRYGFRTELPTEKTDEAHSGQGVKVMEVWIGQAADGAGIRPGDHIIRLNEMEVEQENDLLPLILPVAREIMELQVKRGDYVFDCNLSARGTTITDPKNRLIEAGVNLYKLHQGVEIGSVTQKSPAERAGFRSGDVVLWVNGQKIKTMSSLFELLTRDSKPAQVIIERDGRMSIHELSM